LWGRRAYLRDINRLREKSVIPPALNRLRENRFSGVGREGPGLKPLVFAGLFVELKPHANPKSNYRDFFRNL
jgi:hypothetical protein